MARSIQHYRKQLENDYPRMSEITDPLIKDEKDRIRRDKKTAKFCPICGRKPDEWMDKVGRHIYSGYCEKCDIRFVIHING